jgi:hypothetical protein
MSMIPTTEPVGFTIDNAQFNVQGVMSVQVSSIQPDQFSTQYVRMFQFYTESLSVNANARPCLTVMCYGGNQNTGDTASLELSLPGGILY